MLQHYNSRALVGKLRQFLLLIISRRKLEIFNINYLKRNCNILINSNVARHNNYNISNLDQYHITEYK